MNIDHFTYAQFSKEFINFVDLLQLLYICQKCRGNRLRQKQATTIERCTFLTVRNS